MVTVTLPDDGDSQVDISLPRATGTAATIAVGTVTEGTPLSIVNSGTSTAAVFDFTIPAGGGVSPPFAISDTTGLQASLDGKQPLDADLTSLASAAGTNTLYYRSGAGTWSAVTIGSNLTFTGGTLAATGGGGSSPPFAISDTTGLQTALDGKQPLDSDLTSIAALTTTSYGRGQLTLADAAAGRTYYGLGTIATQAASSVAITGGSITGITDITVADGGTGASTASGARTNLGLVIGTDVQAFDADLSAIAALTGTNTIYYRSAANTWTAVTIGANLTFTGGTLAASGGGGGGATSTIQTFTASGTYTKPAGVKNLYIVAIGGGAGGGSGRRGATSTARSGGGGGGGGGWSDRTIDASLIGATETITIGAAGVGGAAITADDTNGSVGTSGGNTSFGTFVMANGGTAHPTAAAVAALSTTTALGGIGGTIGGVGGGTSVTGSAVVPVRPFGVAPGGGGGGGSFSSGNNRQNGAAGGDSGTGTTAGSNGSYTLGAAGGNGVPSLVGDTASGGGGGGGSNIAAAQGLDGGNGGFPGGGGGGGGASLNGNLSGKGGDGGAGYVIVFETY